MFFLYISVLVKIKPEATNTLLKALNYYNAFHAIPYLIRIPQLMLRIRGLEAKADHSIIQKLTSKYITLWRATTAASILEREKKEAAALHNRVFMLRTTFTLWYHDTKLMKKLQALELKSDKHHQRRTLLSVFGKWRDSQRAKVSDRVQWIAAVAYHTAR